MTRETYEAIVEKIVRSGPRGPYAVARSTELGIITVSLEPPVWNEREFPEREDVILLSSIREKRAGWRAHSGRFVTPSDKKPSNKPATSKRKER